MLRLATENDRVAVLRMCEKFHQASPYSGVAYSSERVSRLFDLYLRDPGKLIVILSDQDGPRGMIVGFSDSPPFSDEKVATELAWWMDEEYRGSKDSLLLFKAYEDWARRVECSVVQMALLSTSPDVGKIYERNGYSLSERTYLKRI